MSYRYVCANGCATADRDHHQRTGGFPHGHTTIAVDVLPEGFDNDKALVHAAIRKAAQAHGNTISPNEIRPLIPATVAPHNIGRAYHQLIAAGVLVELPTPVRSDDVDGGNAGRWISRYEYHPERAA